MELFRKGSEMKFYYAMGGVSHSKVVETELSYISVWAGVHQEKNMEVFGEGSEMKFLLGSRLG